LLGKGVVLQPDSLVNPAGFYNWDCHLPIQKIETAGGRVIMNFDRLAKSENLPPSSVIAGKRSIKGQESENSSARRRPGRRALESILRVS
jgi:hypothetical protein